MTGYLYRGDPGLERVNAEIMAWRAAQAVADLTRCEYRHRGPCRWRCILPLGHAGGHSQYGHRTKAAA